MKRLPRWVRIVGSLVVVLLLLALIVPYFLDVNRYRGTITSQIEGATGRKATIGALRARFLPSVGFTVEQFALGNPQGFAEGNLLAAESIRGSLALVPLLKGEFQLTSVEIVSPHLSLLEDDRGKVNYELEAPKKPGQKKAEPGVTVIIDSIEVSDAQLTMARVTGSRRKVVPVLRAKGIGVTLEDVALDAKRLKEWEADAKLGGVVLQLSGLKMPVEFRSGTLELRKGGIESKFELRVGDVTTAEGSLSVKDIEKAVTTFDLKTSLLDLDKLAAAGAKTESVPATPAKRRSDLLAQGRISAERMRWAPYEVTGATAEIRVYGDRMEVWPVKAAVYGGVLQVSARVDSRQSPERFSANLQLTELDIGKVMAASPDTRGKMTGIAKLDLQVFGVLGGDVLKSLNGTGSFSARDGKFPGFDMGKLGALAKMQQVFTLGQGGWSGELVYTSITGDLKIGGGRVSNDRIHVDSPNGTVDLRGSLGFDRTLNYDGQANLVQTGGDGPKNPAQAVFGVIGAVTKQSVGRISLPFAVRGTFSDPKIQPGRGLPQFSTSSPPQTTQQPAGQQQQQPKKKSIFDIFKKP